MRCVLCKEDFPDETDEWSLCLKCREKIKDPKNLPKILNAILGNIDYIMYEDLATIAEKIMDMQNQIKKLRSHRHFERDGKIGFTN